MKINKREITKLAKELNKLATVSQSLFVNLYYHQDNKTFKLKWKDVSNKYLDSSLVLVGEFLTVANYDSNDYTLEKCQTLIIDSISKFNQ